MTSTPPTAADVALFLQENPQFFQDHADLFANLRVPHPNQARAISLGERQIMTLRGKAKELEQALAHLRHNAAGNEKINRLVINWCAGMLAEPDANQLPTHIIGSLSRLFDLPSVRLYVWDIPALRDTPAGQAATPAMRAVADALDQPYCGPASGHQVASWLEPAPTSLALIALRPDAAAAPIGLLIMGSDDINRFATDMGTEFLQTIGTLAGAGLGRLLHNATTENQPA